MSSSQHSPLKSVNLNAWLFNPFHFVAGSKALVSGLFFMLITAVVAWYGNIHFDGAIDLHIGAKTSPVVYLIEPLVDWLLVAFCFYVAALMLSKSRIRIIDFLGTTALARVAFFPAALISFAPPLQQLSPENMTAAGVILSLVLLVPVIWLVALLYNGFVVSAHLKGSKAVIGFIVALLIAEIVSKFVLHYLYTTV